MTARTAGRRGFLIAGQTGRIDALPLPTGATKNRQNPLDSPAVVTYHPATKRPQRPVGTGAQIAQLVEQRIENPRVGGSIPSLGTI